LPQAIGERIYHLQCVINSCYKDSPFELFGINPRAPIFRICVREGLHEFRQAPNLFELSCHEYPPTRISNTTPLESTEVQHSAIQVTVFVTPKVGIVQIEVHVNQRNVVRIASHLIIINLCGVSGDRHKRIFELVLEPALSHIVREDDLRGDRNEVEREFYCLRKHFLVRTGAFRWIDA